MGGLCFILCFLELCLYVFFFSALLSISLSNNFPSPITPPASLPSPQSSSEPWNLALSMEAHPWLGRSWSGSLLCLLNDGWTGKLRIQVLNSCFYSGVCGWGEFLHAITMFDSDCHDLHPKLRSTLRQECPVIIWVFLAKVSEKSSFQKKSENQE